MTDAHFSFTFVFKQPLNLPLQYSIWWGNLVLLYFSFLEAYII